MKITAHIYDTYKVVLFWGIISSICAGSGLYIYFIQQAVVNVVDREKIEQHVSDLVTNLSQKEFAYISKKNDITLATAYQLGYQDVTEDESQYISTPETGLSMVSRDEVKDIR